MKICEFLTQGNWTQGHCAVDNAECDCSPYGKEACKWCLWGALLRLTNGCDYLEYKAKLDKLHAACKKLFPDLGCSLIAVNDKLGWEAVDAVLKEANV